MMARLASTKLRATVSHSGKKVSDSRALDRSIATQNRLTSAGFERDQKNGAVRVFGESLDGVVSRERRHRSHEPDILKSAELQTAGHEIAAGGCGQ